jgi:formylglycine-generating enzyme required for sulfatase activity/serine/threonine protein kinase
MEDLTGKQLGPYQIVSRLGAGGMATVFKAYQPKMDRYVALKVLQRHFSNNPQFVNRFSQEARLIAKLEHPHILPVYDFGESDGYTFLAMRLVQGGSLSDLLKKCGKLELAKINRIITQVGGALDYAHEKGVIHRDFKPGNVLIDEFESCLLTDFGIAKLVEVTSHLTHTGGILGTPFYISPEQGSGKPIDNRSDIYSLGVVLYQMAVGDVPYKADTPMSVIFKHVHDPLPLPRHRVPDLPEPVERVILKALAKNPGDRYSTAAELVNALQSAIDQLTSQIQKVREPIFETDPTQMARKIPTDPEKLSAKPSDTPRPETVEIKKTGKKKKDRTGRGWAYGVLAIFLLALSAGAGWLYYNNTFLSEPILRVDTNPAGANVYVDDGYVGISPIQIEKLTPGAHKVRISKKEYEDYKENLSIGKGKPGFIQVVLTPKPFGGLVVDSNPSGSEVFVDNHKRGITPLSIESLPIGTREVMIKKQGYEKKTLWVSLEAGQVKTLDIVLKRMAPSPQRQKISNSLGMEFVYIPPGTFMMGSAFDEPGRNNNEKLHKVTLTQGFYLQTTEVTLDQWRAFIRDTKYSSEAETGKGAWIRRGGKWSNKKGRYWDNPGFYQTENDPVTCVSWNDVQSYIKWLNRKEKKKYRLPTESEWEYACRAGSTTAFANGAISELKCGYDSHLNDMGWYCGNSNRKTHPVSKKKPNLWGLYDMHGNVWEWCQDWYEEYPSGSITNPTGPSQGSRRVRRGGGWGNDALDCRSSFRGKFWPEGGTRGIGFRLLMEP